MRKPGQPHKGWKKAAQHKFRTSRPNKGKTMNVLNDNVSQDVPVQAEQFVIAHDAEGNEIRIPVEGEVQTVQDREFSDVPAGN